MKRFRKLAAVFFAMVTMILVMPMTAYADSIYIESMGITVNTKETPTKTIVVDKREVLNAGQIEQIESAGERLKVYNIGLYIEMTEKANNSQEYANELSERKFDELMSSKENSIMIVFSFHEDAEGFYAVHYNIQGNMIEGEVNRLIRNSYHEFKTDATWIAGSFEQIVDYLVEVEENLINADAIAEQNRALKSTLLKLARAVTEALAVAMIIYLVWENKRDEKAWRKDIEQKNREIKTLTKEGDKKDQKLDKLQRKLAELTEWKENAIESTPEVESRIADYLAKKRANDFNKRFRKAESFEELARMIAEYDAMSTQEKGHVKLNVVRAREKLDELAHKEADKATKTIEEICQLTGDRHNRQAYNNAMNYYNGLPQCVRILIAAQLARRLADGHSRAESDYTRHQSEYTNYHNPAMSNSSFHSSGGFHSGTFGGGFGGGH